MFDQRTIDLDPIGGCRRGRGGSAKRSFGQRLTPERFNADYPLFPNGVPAVYVIQAYRGRENAHTKGEFGTVLVSVNTADVTGVVVRTSSGSSVTRRFRSTSMTQRRHRGRRTLNSWRSRLTSTCLPERPVSTTTHFESLQHFLAALALRLHLAPHHVVIDAACAHQLLVRAPLDDATTFHQQDQIGAANRRQPVGDDERRSAPSDAIDTDLNSVAHDPREQEQHAPRRRL
jgi:hypothetical protein